MSAFYLSVSTASLQRRDEPVALADDRLDEPRLLGIVTNRQADFSNRGVHRRIVLDEHTRIPQCSLNVLALHKAVGALDEEDQHLHRNLSSLMR